MHFLSISSQWFISIIRENIRKNPGFLVFSGVYLNWTLAWNWLIKTVQNIKYIRSVKNFTQVYTLSQKNQISPKHSSKNTGFFVNEGKISLEPLHIMQKQPPEMLYKKRCTKFKGKHLRQCLFFNKVSGS